jgi:hypothetical protein
MSFNEYLISRYILFVIVSSLVRDTSCSNKERNLKYQFDHGIIKFGEGRADSETSPYSKNSAIYIIYITATVRYRT